MPKNTETTNETNEQDATSMLVGYVRRSGAGGGEFLLFACLPNEFAQPE